MIGEIHHVRGRLRVRMPELKRNEAKAQALQHAIAAERGIRSVEVNLLTGSLLVYFDPKLISAEDVLATIGNPVRPQAGRPGLQAKIAGAMWWWAIEKVVERSIPLVIRALL